MENQKQKIFQWFNQFAKDYDNDPVTQSWCHNGGNPIDLTMFDTWAGYVQKYFKTEAHHKLLDVGCGSGLFLTRFKQFTEHLYGADPAGDVIGSAKRRNPEFILQVADAANVGFGDVKFDRIFCNSVLFYLNNMDECKKVVEHFFDISTRDAKIWLGDIPMPNPALTDENFQRVETTTKWKVQHYPPQFFYEICDAHGFKSRLFFQEVPQKKSSAYRYDLLIEK